MLKYAKTEFVFYDYKFGHSCATASQTIILCVLIAGASTAIQHILVRWQRQQPIRQRV